MNTYLKAMSCCMLLFMGMQSFAQTSSPHQLPAVLLPSPNAAELGKYGNLPVSLSTGAMNYNIPLLNLINGNIKLGISLSYNAGGIKVDQAASRAGLGWVLDAGGMVNRTVYGDADEFALNEPKPSNFPANDTLTGNFLRRSSLNLDGYDTQPDVFSFNFNGYAGRFILDPTDKSKVKFFEKSNLKVQTNFTAGNVTRTITITDPNGIRYYFGGTGATETSRTLSGGSGCGNTHTTATQNAWYLTKIKDLNGDSIVLSYKPVQVTYETSVSQTNLVQNVETRLMELFDPPLNKYVYPQPGSQTTCVGSVINEGVYLDKITSSKGDQVVFSYTTRPDIPTDVLFSKIEYGLTGETPLKTYGLTYVTGTSPSGFYSASSNSENTQRPYLATLKENSKGLLDFKLHQFHYYHKNDLPPRLSYSQDAYGFYNGTTNQSLLPADPTGLFTYTAGDRGSYSGYADYGMLSKVIYPTMGSDSIIYESHTASSFVYGGARVKQVITYDPVSAKNMTKSYAYKIYPALTNSSGVPLREPMGYFSPVTMRLTNSSGAFMDTYYTLASSGGNSSLYAESGSHFAYSSVVESDSTGFINGGTLHLFNINTDPTPNLDLGYEFPNKPFGASGLPAVIPYYERTFRNAAGTHITQKEVFTHTKSIKTDSLMGYYGRRDVVDYYNYAAGYSLSSYPLNFYWNYTDSVKVITYDPDGLNPVTQLTENFYDNSTHLQLTRTRSAQSDGRLLTKQLSYPHEMVSTLQDPTGVYAGMVALNKIAPVIEEQVSLPSSVLVSKVKTNYYEFNTSQFLPQTVDEYNRASGSYETRLRFSNYDVKGNILSLAQEKGSKISYIWSFKRTLPVAELKNVDYSTFVSTIGATAINNFANLASPDKATIAAFMATVRTAFPNALISSMSHIQGVGPDAVSDTRGVDAFYEYDSFQRLRLVKDQNGDITKAISYNYANTPVFNASRSQTFTRNNCAPGSTGGSVTYTVPANTYSASTLAAANAIADEDIALNGQAYANANGTCTANVSVALDVDVSPDNTFEIKFHNTTTSVDYTYTQANSYTTVTLPQGTYVVTVMNTTSSVAFYTATIFGQDILFRKSIVATWAPAAMTGAYTLTIKNP